MTSKHKKLELLRALRVMKELQEASKKTIFKNIFEIFTFGTTEVDGKYMYLDRKKYRGKGRPKKSDYVESQPLFIDQ